MNVKLFTLALALLLRAHAMEETQTILMRKTCAKDLASATIAARYEILIRVASMRRDIAHRPDMARYDAHAIVTSWGKPLLDMDGLKLIDGSTYYHYIATNGITLGSGEAFSSLFPDIFNNQKVFLLSDFVEEAKDVLASLKK